MPNTLDGIQPKSYLNFIDIEQFKQISTIGDNHGIPLSNRFVCLLNAPKNKAQFRKNGWLEFQVASCELPNISISPSELEINGAKRFYFKGRTDSDLSITFYETPDLLLRRFFFSWMSEAVNVSENGVVRNYMADYMPSPSEFLIFPLNYHGDAYYCDRFVNVFPYDVSGITYNYSRGGEVIQTTVKFKYMFHNITPLDNSDNYHISTNGNRDSRQEWNK
jgi:hypothetical protein